MTPNQIDAPVAQPAIANPLSLPHAEPSPHADLARTTLAVLCMLLIASAALWILWPFMPAIVWATMVVVALWTPFLGLQGRLWGKRWAAVAVMTVGLLLVFVIPFSLAVTVIATHTEDIGKGTRSLLEMRLPPAPAWIEQAPLVGAPIANAWNEIVAQGSEAVSRTLGPHTRTVARWLFAQMGSVGAIIVQFLLTVAVAAIFFATGEKVVAAVVAFMRRLAGSHGENVVWLSGRAIRSVALGVMLTAFVQSVLGGVGLFAAGIPFPGLLTVFMFLLAVAQIGPFPVLIGAVVWSYSTSESAWVPAALLVWSILVGLIDNVLRPILIKRGGDLPLVMVFAGVVGGLLSFGLVGIFLGPVILAVVYTLLKAWVLAERDSAESAAAPPQSAPPSGGGAL